MFKLIPPKYFASAVAWTTLFIFSAINGITPVLEGLGITPKASWAVMAVQALVTLIIVTPAWRLIWRAVPGLNRWVFPDLNGEWDVEGDSNWDRIAHLIGAAKGAVPAFDMITVDEAVLPPLKATIMRARIKHTFASIRIILWNPTNTGPIKESKTVLVEPVRGEDGRHGLAYIFKQENLAAAPGDERTFNGAGLVTQDRDDPDLLCGRMWTDRMWHRGMNTAADIRFRRIKR